MRIFRLVLVLLAIAAVSRTAAAQQRPLMTEDPEVIGAGRILLEGGLDFSHDAHYPLSGLEGNLWRMPILGVSFGVSSIAEVQIDGGPFDYLTITHRHPAPLAGIVTATDNHTHDVDDIVIGTKIKLVTEAAKRPSIGFRFATRLPNASNESGLGLDTTDFYASLLFAKTAQSIRIVGNGSFGILGDPVDGHTQNDVLTYGLSVSRALTNKVEFVGEVNGRVSFNDIDYPGTESKGRLNFGGRYTHGPVRFDGGVFFGLTSVDPTIGVTGGFTYVFSAFTVP